MDSGDPTENNFDHVTGLVERVTFHSPESGFTVLRVKVRGHHGLVAVVGTLPSVSAGEWVDSKGMASRLDEFSRGRRYRKSLPSNRDELSATTAKIGDSVDRKFTGVL